MATSKTGSFWLTETVEIAAGDTSANGTIDLGAYVDVGDQQAVAIEMVDFIWQDNSAGVYSGNLDNAVAADSAFDAQLTDLNPNGLIVRADDNTLIASGSLSLANGDNILSFGPDFYPDNFGKLDESRMVVNDSLYLVATSAVAPIVVNHALAITVRIKARIVKLSTKDWMAIAIQSTAADN